MIRRSCRGNRTRRREGGDETEGDAAKGSRDFLQTRNFLEKGAEIQNEVC